MVFSIQIFLNNKCQIFKFIFGLINLATIMSQSSHQVFLICYFNAIENLVSVIPGTI